MQINPPVLRVLGTGVTLIDTILASAEADLGIRLDFIALDGIEAQRRGVLAPDSFDIYDQWFHDLDLIWPARSLRPIDVSRINCWDQVRNWPVLRAGADRDVPNGDTLNRDNLNGGVLSGSPLDRLFVQESGELGCEDTGRISMLPTVYNADSFAIIGESSAPDPTSWGDLLSEDWRGRVAIQADAAIGVPDLLLALRTRGEFQCENPGNLSLSEIGSFIRLVKQYQLSGHFAGFWTDTTPSTGRSAKLSTMWWSNYLSQKARGMPIRMCAPAEGYRGWCGGMALSQSLDPRTEELAYAYLNWWLSGPAGAIMARNGAYMAAPGAARAHLSPVEWDFWYDGKPAAADICDAFGNVVYHPGDLREGGSCETRQRQIVIWNSVMEEHNFLVRLWEVITSKALI
ncbi:extracellular solute-binding protein [Marinovum sp. 2_MG-2023]|nr:extracellular solute-binding protein [Marinovum sp. 2_MG-2023]MDO6780237.1 extracellular solute-binding protein [Marinovum sp. 1_MG-2023]